MDALLHLRDVHGRMVVCSPSDAGMMPTYYAQNHVIDGAYPAQSGPHAIERDLVTQLEFESLDGMRAAVETPYYRERLRPDEPRFVDDTTVARLHVLPEQIVKGDRTKYKLFSLISRAADVDDDIGDHALGIIRDGITGLPGAMSVVENAVLPPPVGNRFVDIVFEIWFDTPEAALAAAPIATSLFKTEGMNHTASLAIVVEEFTQERLRKSFGCQVVGPTV